MAGGGDRPYAGIGQAAFVADELVGLFLGHVWPSNDRPQERVVFLDGGVRPERRRSGIGTRLVAAVLAECRRADGAGTVFATLQERDIAAGAIPFLEKHGFAEVPDMLRYERDLVADPPAHPASAEEIVAIPYGGDDPEVDSAIADLYRRAYTGRRAIPRLSGEAVQKRSADPAWSHFLVYDGDLLVGYASSHPSAEGEYSVDSLAVARSHWRSGTSDSLARAIIRHAAEKSFRTVVGYVEATNHASRAMVERHGLTRMGRLARYSRSLCDGR
jgi:ribosomal protein S18 acetylase RimI-like enzyme